MTDFTTNARLRPDHNIQTRDKNCLQDPVDPHRNPDGKTLHPFVYWSQSGSIITLKVPLTQIENLQVSLSDDQDELEFFAFGRGAHGFQQYTFSLSLFSQVEKEFDHKTTELYLLITLKKQIRELRWSRLTKQHINVPWLRIDFERFTDEFDQDNSDSSQSDDELRKERQSYELLKQQLEDAKNQKLEAEIQRDKNVSSDWAAKLETIYKNNTNIFNQFKKRIAKKRDKASKMKYDYRNERGVIDSGRNTARRALDYKRAYLFLYNLAMFVMFLSVYIILLIKGLSGNLDDDTIQGAARLVKILTYTQLLESIYPILGLVPGGPMLPLTQVSGRILCNYFLSIPVIRGNCSPFAFYLFIVWSSIELFRYSFYALRVYKVDIYPITWCRYTLFIPLYPMGGLCESMVLFSTIRYYETTGGLSISLPNEANISFSLPIVLKIYIYLLLFPTIYYLMRYMWAQRCRQLKDKSA